MRLLLTPVLLVPVLLTPVQLVTATSSATAGIPWRTDLEAAQREAAEQGKLVLAHFEADQCPHCNQLNRGAFQDSQVQGAITQSFIPLKIDGPRQMHLVKAFDVQAYPADVFLTAEGTILEQRTSPQPAEQYLAMLQQVLVGGAAPGAASATMAQSSQNESAGTQDPSNQSATNQASTNQAPSRSGSMSLPGGLAGYNRSSGAGGGVDAQMAGVRLTQPSNGKPSSGNPPVAAEAAADLSPENAILDGFCPVTMVQERAWELGDPEIGAVHLGKLYLFASEAHRETFLADPEQFAPVMNGIDVVKFLEDRQVVPGRREFGFFERNYNRVFLFSSEETMTRFYDRFESYAVAAIDITERAAEAANPRR